MPATAAAEAMGLTIDRNANTIRLVRRFGAHPDVIFAAWTEAEQIACWWDPSGEKLAECTIDLRPGGSFRFVTAGHAGMPFGGVYRRIERPHYLEFEAMGSTGRVRLEPAAGGTQMTVEIQCHSREQLEQFIQRGVAAGTSQTLDNLVGYVKARSGSITS